MVEAALTASQGEEGIDELRLILTRVDGLFTGGSERIQGDGRVGQGHLEKGLAQHERGAQLVGSVGDEAPLGVEGRFEAGEKPVDGVAEVLELVVRAGERETLVQVALRDLAGGGGHDLEWSEDSSRDDPAKQHGHPDHGDENGARTDEELARVEGQPSNGHGRPVEPVRLRSAPVGRRADRARTIPEHEWTERTTWLWVLGQDDHDVGDDAEDDARGKEEAAVERGEAKASVRRRRWGPKASSLNRWRLATGQPAIR
jgi:hypothetical protein